MPADWLKTAGAKWLAGIDWGFMSEPRVLQVVVDGKGMYVFNEPTFIGKFDAIPKLEKIEIVPSGVTFGEFKIERFTIKWRGVYHSELWAQFRDASPKYWLRRERFKRRGQRCSNGSGTSSVDRGTSSSSSASTSDP